MKPQRGFALFEAIAIVAIVSLGAGVLLAAAAAAAKLSAAPGGNRTAAALVAAQTLRTAGNAWKYGTPGTAPSGSIPATMRLQGSTETVPITISSAISSQTTNGAAITITVSYPPAPTGNDSGAVTMTGALRIKAPLPGAQVERPGLIPQPGTR